MGLHETAFICNQQAVIGHGNNSPGTTEVIGDLFNLVSSFCFYTTDPCLSCKSRRVFRIGAFCLHRWQPGCVPSSISLRCNVLSGTTGIGTAERINNEKENRKRKDEF